MTGRGTLLFVALLAALPATADVRLLGREDGAGLTLGGYARAFDALESVPFLVGSSETTERSWVHAAILRLEWKGKEGDRLSAEIHDRFLGVETAGPGVFPSIPAGVGVSAVPGRWVDLHSVLGEGPGVSWVHDLDRLDVRIHTSMADWTLGRQAITWGDALLFPVADLWSPLSPFDLDPTEKLGTDAVRAIASLPGGGELELVVAPRARASDDGAGLRASESLSWGDVYVAGAKLWHEDFAFAGVEGQAGFLRFRAEGGQPWDLDRRRFEGPRGTIGLDWIHTGFQVSIEGHYDGSGASDPSGYYAQAVTAPYFARGESYFLGRTYWGAIANWKLIPLFDLNGAAIENLRDPSLMVTASVAWHVNQNADLLVGVFQGLGARPELLPLPEIQSEFGGYGSTVWGQMAVFF